MPIRITPSVLKEPSHTNQTPQSSVNEFPNIVVPGEIVFTSGANLITGHGTFRVDTVETDDTARDSSAIDSSQTADALPESASALPMYASLAGRLKSVNKLMYVEPPNARYAGHVGDTVVGRIVEVEQRRWKVDVNSYHLANLSLANVKLPTGELRRKSEDDERAMRSFLREGDLIVAEVREVYRDGSLQLHMPGKRTGRLGEGCLLRLSPSLIRRQKIHRHQLAVPSTDASEDDKSGPQETRTTPVGLILGCNGLVWTGPARGMDLGECLGAVISGDRVLSSAEERGAVSRVRNVVLALAAQGMQVWETSVLAGCEASFIEELQHEGEDQELRVTRLLLPEHQKHLATLVTAKLPSS